MNKIRRLLQEQYQHRYLISRLSWYELKTSNGNSYLGMTWELLNPLIQILVYWFVFQSIRNRSGVDLSTGDSVPFIYWMVVGFVLWQFFFRSTIDGSKSIYSRLSVLSKMNFPLSAVPSYTMMAQLYIHGALLALLLLVFLFSGYGWSLYTLQLLYFLGCTCALLFSISLITSTLSTMVRDVHLLLNSVLRMFLYLSPVLWQIDQLAPPIGSLSLLNPLHYVIEGYRAAFFGTEWYLFTHVWEGMYFWGLVLFLGGIGAHLHLKFRDQFMDYL